MELPLHYVWKHKMLPLRELRTGDGRAVELIDPGLYNTDAGPDFFNAKVKIDGTLWVGNVEIHDRASDWYTHGHDRDPAYDNVVLHVVKTIDTDNVTTHSGNSLPQMELQVPPAVERNYRELLATMSYPPCYRVIPSLPRLLTHSWLNALQIERLERKTDDIQRRLQLSGGSWEAAVFVTLARYYGFGVNGDAFETWALHIPLDSIAHHRDDVFQIEAIFMGQAGLLDECQVPEYYRAEAAREGYLERLRSEYHYLARKFNLTPMNASLWRFLRLRPQNFPHIRLSQLANLYCSRRTGLSSLTGCRTVAEAKDVLRTSVTHYWETHYTFGSTSTKTAKTLSDGSLNSLIINVAAPVLFAYGRQKQEESLCERAVAFLEELRAENNFIVRMWQQCGLVVATAGDSQALIQLKREYCDRKDCLRCRFGYEYLTSRAQPANT